MLARHLVAVTRPQALKENIVIWKNYRVTVLQDRLFRLETGAPFRDGATQAVFFRDMPPQEFTFEDRGEEALIRTPACSLLLKKRRGDCRILLNGEEKKICNEGNLGGTYRTLDGCNGGTYIPPEPWKKPRKLRLGCGVCSRTGVAVYPDEASLTLSENGEVLPERGAGRDEYIFAYGHDYRAAVKALYLITGMPPVIPRFALGNWWSRYHPYTADEYLRLMGEFGRREIPFTVATVDMDWHHSDANKIDERFAVSASGRNTPEYVGNWIDKGWTGYTWNEELFPDHADFLSRLHEKGLAVTLNLHPSDGVRYWEKQYRAMAAALGREPDGKRIPFDIADPDFVNAYFSVLHRPYEEEGVSFWWIDWQQGETSGMDGLDPLWALNHYHFLDHAATHEEPLILSRYAGVGSHRYPLGFSGDTYTTWATLAYLPYFTATASNVGYTWWSHDIGGHQKGEKRDELYLRHIEYGVFSPICRLHGTRAETMTKEPSFYGAYGEAAAEYLRFRDRLIPYLETCARRTHEEGIALVEPLYYRHDVPEAYRYLREYYFGDLLVVPACEKARSGYARVKAWLPEGVWTDIFTGDRYEVKEGGKELVLLRRPEEFPVFAPAGFLLPLGGKKLQVRVYAGSGAFTLRSSLGEFRLSSRAEEGVQRFFCETEEHCDAEIVFCDIPPEHAALFVNGQKARAEDARLLTVSLPLGGKTEVKVLFPEESGRARFLRRARRVLTCAEGKNEEKERLYAELCAAKEDFSSIIQRSALPRAVKDRLTETL